MYYQPSGACGKALISYPQVYVTAWQRQKFLEKGAKRGTKRTRRSFKNYLDVNTSDARPKLPARQLCLRTVRFNQCPCKASSYRSNTC